MIPEGELRLISSWTTPTTLDHPYYTVLLYCMINVKVCKGSKHIKFWDKSCLFFTNVAMARKEHLNCEVTAGN